MSESSKAKKLSTLDKNLIFMNANGVHDVTLKMLFDFTTASVEIGQEEALKLYLPPKNRAVAEILSVIDRQSTGRALRGWIDWAGGPIPVGTDDIVLVMLVNGSVLKDPAGLFNWLSNNSVKRYKLVERVESKAVIKDPGGHYRKVYRKKLTIDDVSNGYVDFQIDPFRIAKVYKMNSLAMETVLKKCLVSGGRGHKDKKTDLLDIISAAQRELEIMSEDGE